MERSNKILSQPPKLTKEQINKIVQQKLKNIDFKIIDYKLLPLDTRNGFLGEHRRLLITIERENGFKQNLNCFAKFLPENEAQIEFTIICGVFKKEIFIYEELFTKFEEIGIEYLKSVVPECYYTEDNFALVFEDVTKRGYKPISKFGRLDYDHVWVTLKSMAKMHASSLIFEEKMSKKLNREYRLLDEYSDYFYETFYINDPQHKGGQGVHAALKGLYTGFKLYPEENYDINNECFKENVDKTCLDIFELVKPSKKYRNVLCHGDLWSTNIMIKYNKNKPIDCLILDFQTTRYCPPAHDFTSFIYLTTTRKFRENHLSSLQKLYYTELETLLKPYDCDLENIIPFEGFLKSCEEQKRFAIIQNVTYVQLTQVKDEWLKKYIKDAEKWNEALYEDRSRMVTENCNCDPEYRAVFGEGLKDLADICKVQN